jgi:hypothetical protein
MLLPLEKFRKLSLFNADSFSERTYDSEKTVSLYCHQRDSFIRGKCWLQIYSYPLVFMAGFQCKTSAFGDMLH